MSHEELSPLHFEVKLVGCPYRDEKDMKIFLLATDLYSELFDIDQEIRARLKHGQDVSEAEAAFLENLRSNMEVLRLVE